MTNEEAYMLVYGSNMDMPIDQVLEILSNVNNYEDEPEALDNLTFFVIKDLYNKDIDFEQLTEDELDQVICDKCNLLIMDKTFDNLVKKGVLERLIDGDGNFSYRKVV